MCYTSAWSSEGPKVENLPVERSNATVARGDEQIGKQNREVEPDLIFQNDEEKSNSFNTQLFATLPGREIVANQSIRSICSEECEKQISKSEVLTSSELNEALAHVDEIFKQMQLTNRRDTSGTGGLTEQTVQSTYKTQKGPHQSDEVCCSNCFFLVEGGNLNI